MVIKLVKCTSDYWEFVRLLRSDSRVQSGFIEQVDITPEQQKGYMNKYSDSYRVCLVDNMPAGFVGVIDEDIRVCTHPDYQNKGIAKYMIQEIIKEFPKAYAKVKVDNEASLRLFESCGFSKQFYILKQW
jgi:ribosomal protein S18 acetylase RimI-like enzyme